jgi:hypothetical protein
MKCRNSNALYRINHINSMTLSLSDNPSDRLRQLVQFSNVHIFLTGKAGTGKTTLLKDLCATVWKNNALIAPTGVAAINAGGSTIHSFFKLHPFTFLPEGHLPRISGHNFENAFTLSRSVRLNKEKVRILQRLELLIIDEISMVRCDMLDAIDLILKRYRKNHLPFGGLQLLLCGDLNQLPPVIPEAELPYVTRCYPSGYFFESRALKQAGYIPIELNTVYRQDDPAFLSILNEIRSGFLSSENAALLNTRHNFKLSEQPGEGYITLTTHVAQSNRINARQLDKIEAPSLWFKARIVDEFPKYLYPADVELELKIGAQVMFIRNNKELNYFNGKIGWVHAFDKETDLITIRCDNEEYIEVAREVWEYQQYGYDSNKNAIRKDTLGRFYQYPLRLAWAITIHKSQGLTFDRAVVDTAKAFAPGQTYVALSRCRRLEGLILKSRMEAGEQLSDDRIEQYYDSFPSEQELCKAANRALELFPQQLVFDTLSFRLLSETIAPFERLAPQLLAAAPHAAGVFTEMAQKTSEMLINGKKYLPEALEAAQSFERDKLLRYITAMQYFRKNMLNQIVKPLLQGIMQNEALKGEQLLRKNFRKLAEQLPDMFHALTISEAYFTGIIDNDASNMAARIKEKEKTVLNLLLELKTAVGAKQTTERKRSARKKSKQVYQ